MTLNDENVGERIKKLRVENKLTQQELAEAIGTNRTYLAHIESGFKNAGKQLIIKLAEFFGVSPDYIEGDWRFIEKRFPAKKDTKKDFSKGYFESRKDSKIDGVSIRESFLDTNSAESVESLAESLEMRKSIGQLFLKDCSADKQYKYADLIGLKLRMCVAKDISIANTSLARLVLDDSHWNALRLTGVEFEILRGYFAFGGDRKIIEWIESIRFMRFAKESIELNW